MAFNIDYGPIGSALGYAQQAGRAQGSQLGFEDLLNAAGMFQRAKSLSLQENSQAIQNALSNRGLDLEAQRNQATQQLANQQAIMNNQYRNASLQSMDAFRQGRNNIGQQNADTAATRVGNQNDYNQGRLDVAQQNADTAGQRADSMDAYRQGLLSVLQQNAQTRQQQAATSATQGGDKNAIAAENMKTQALGAEINALTKQVADAQRNFTDPNDPNLQAAKQRLQQIEMGLKTRNDSLLFGGTQVNPSGRTMIQRLPNQGAGQGQQQAGSSPASAVTVTTQAQYDQLPPGAYYVDSNGTLAQKGGATPTR